LSTHCGAQDVIKCDSHTNTRLDPYGLELSTSQLGDQNIQNSKLEETMADDKKRQAKRVAAENGVFVFYNICNYNG
jgi:hypothetical protein